MFLLQDATMLMDWQGYHNKFSYKRSHSIELNFTLYNDNDNDLRRSVRPKTLTQQPKGGCAHLPNSQRLTKDKG